MEPIDLQRESFNVYAHALETALHIAHSRNDGRDIALVDVLKDARTIVRFLEGPKPRKPKAVIAVEASEIVEG